MDYKKLIFRHFFTDSLHKNAFNIAWADLKVAKLSNLIFSGHTVLPTSSANLASSIREGKSFIVRTKANVAEASQTVQDFPFKGKKILLAESM